MAFPFPTLSSHGWASISKTTLHFSCWTLSPRLFSKCVEEIFDPTWSSWVGPTQVVPQLKGHILDSLGVSLSLLLSVCLSVCLSRLESMCWVVMFTSALASGWEVLFALLLLWSITAKMPRYHREWQKFMRYDSFPSGLELFRHSFCVHKHTWKPYYFVICFVRFLWW